MRNIKKALLVLTIMCITCFVFIYNEACAETVVININPGESYEFKNNDASARSVSIKLSGSERSYDYAIYNKDGTDNKQGISVSTSSLTIPAKGRLVITGQKGQIECRVDDSYIISSISNEPALSRVTVKAGESYAFINNDTVAHQIVNEGSSSSRRFDYAVYTLNGKEYAQDMNVASLSYVTVPAGGRIVVTSLNGNIDFGGYYDFFVAEKSSDPALRRVTVKAGESYVFINNDTVAHQIVNEGSSSNKFDYAVYTRDGKEYDQNINQGYTSSITVPAGGRIIVTPTTVDMDFAGYYNFFVVEKSSDPALRRVTIKAGESYAFINTDIEAHEIRTNVNISTTRFDYAIYNSDGTAYNQIMNSISASFTIPAGGRVVVTPTTVDMDFGGYYSFFVIEKSNDPALRRVTVEPGESYEFINTDRVEHKLMTPLSLSEYYNYAIYNSDGTEYKQDIYCRSYGLIIPAGARVVVTSLTHNISFGGYYKFFEAKKTDEPALRAVTLKPGASYEFKNNDTVEHEMMCPANSGRYDYAIYNSDGTVYGQGLNHGSGVVSASITIPAGGRVIITSLTENTYFGGYYKFFTAQKSNEPALSKATIKPGETYTFINTASVNLPVLTTSSSSKRIDVSIYDSNGNEVSKKTSTYSSKIEIPAGGKLLIKSLSSDIQCAGYYAYFTSFYNDNEGGVNWQNTLSSTGNLYAITQGNNKYVAVGKGGAIYISDDCKVWESVNSGTTNDLYDVIWDGRQFICTGYNGTILTSIDGVNWAPQSSNATGFIKSIAYNGEIYVAVGNAGTILTSTDSITWTKRVSDTNYSIFSVIYGNNEFVAVGAYGLILTSNDGVNWTKQISGVDTSLNTVVWNGTQYAAFGSGIALTSTDGIIWEELSVSSSVTFLSSVNGEDRTIAVGENGILYESLDGKKWVSKPTGTLNNLNDIMWDGNNYIAVGDNGVIVYGIPFGTPIPPQPPEEPNPPQTPDPYTVGDLTFTDILGNPIQSPQPGTMIVANTIVTKSDSSESQATLLIVLYSESNKMEQLSLMNINLSKDQSIKFGTSINLPNDIEGYSIKAFVWDSLGNQKPLSNAISYRNIGE